MSFLAELRRRNVFRVGLAYIVTSWLLLQIGDTLLDTLGAPDWVMPTLLGLLALGFLPALFFAWAFEITPEGIKPERDVPADASITHETGHKLDIVIIVMLLCVGGFTVWQSQQAPAMKEGTPQAVDESPAAPEPAGSGRAQSTAADDKSIAVLPFVNLSSDPEQEYFSDGISEELLNVLAQVPELRVAARTSSFQFKGDNRDIGEIARLLNVNHVLEGSVRKAGTRLRITAQLIEARNGYHLWSNTYDRELDDVFAIQDEISAAIGDALKAELGITEQQSLVAPRVAETANTAAYEAYLKGRYLVNQRGNRAISEAVRELEKSIRLDPEFAPAQAQLAIAIALSADDPSSYGDLTVAEINARAVPHAEIAMRLNPELAESWGAKSIIANANGDWPAAMENASKALSLNPVYTDALNWLQTSALQIGRYQEAEDAINTLMEVDPLSVVGRINYLSNHLSQTDPEAARTAARELVTQHEWAGYATLSRIAIAEGKVSEALYWSLKSYAADPLDRWSNQFMVWRFCDLDMPQEALRVSDVTQVVAEGACGNLEKALSRLERLIEQDPENQSLREWRPVLHYWMGNKAAALADWSEIAEGRGALPMISGAYGVKDHLQYSWLLQESGRIDAADAELAKIDRDLAKREGTSTASYGNLEWDRGLLAFLRGNRKAALQHFRAAVTDGHYDRWDFDDPMLAPLADNPAFAALRKEVMEFLAAEREKALVMICTDNPVPDHWQPLVATCENVDRG